MHIIWFHCNPLVYHMQIIESVELRYNLWNPTIATLHLPPSHNWYSTMQNKTCKKSEKKRVLLWNLCRLHVELSSSHPCWCRCCRTAPRVYCMYGSTSWRDSLESPAGFCSTATSRDRWSTKDSPNALDEAEVLRDRLFKGCPLRTPVARKRFSKSLTGLGVGWKARHGNRAAGLRRKNAVHADINRLQ